MTLGELPVGSMVSNAGAKCFEKPIIWRVLEHNHEGDPENSTSLVSDKIIATYPFDAKEPNNPYEDFSQYGNSKYGVSNIFQWLNSDSKASEWYNPMHEYDHEPSEGYVEKYPYENKAGFLYEFSNNFKNEMMEITKKVIKQVGKFETVTEYDDNVIGKVHILSIEEVGMTSGSAIILPEGKKYSYFSDRTKVMAYPTSEIASLWGGLSNENYKSSITVRSSKEKGVVGEVTENGYGNGRAINKTRIRPQICLPIATPVSEVPNENNIYEILIEKDPAPPAESDYPEEPMDGIWRTPKTDWTETDAFNLKDYKRIRNNLLFLRNRISDIWGEFSIRDMGNDPTDPKYIWKVQYFNAIEENLETINKHSLLVRNYGFKQTFYNNGAFIGFSELNRIESATLQMKRIIDGWEEGLRRMSFRLGAPKGLYL